MICQVHLHTIIRELKRKGLYHLISQDARERDRKLAAWTQGNTMRDEFDPLIVCLIEIQAKARLLITGISVADCALCASRRLGQNTDAIWVSGFTDLMLKVAEQNNLPLKRSA